MDNILNKIFPPRCLFCNKVGDIFCDYCLSKCILLKTQRCIVCGNESQDGYTHIKCLKNGVEPSQLFCTYEYVGLVRDCIRKAKYGSRQFMALKSLAKEGAILASEWNPDFLGYVCCPIPVSSSRITMRGFNQAVVIAKYVSKYFRLDICDDLLVRNRDTQVQYDKSREARFKNIQGSFSVKKSASLKNAKVLLIDDICTSGATLREAAAELYKSGCADVKCFALSKRL